tara:strand:+ start:1317 stop:1520 length:204 start_codon:yes stop_codon:yes gene_type:complete
MTDYIDYPEIIDLNQYSKIIRCSKRRLYHLIETDQVPRPFKIAGRYFIKRSVVADWLENKQAQALAA